MNDDELGRILGDAFDRQARASVPESAAPPHPRFAAAPAPRRRAARFLAPLAAAAAVVALVTGVLIVQRGGSGDTAGNPIAGRSTSVPSPSPAVSSASSTAVGGVPVRVRLHNADGDHVGVGMPVIAYFSRPITDASALSKATRLTVDGKPAQGAWYFERSAALPGYPVEGHFRMESYWPADASISVALPIAGLPAGRDYHYADGLTLSFTTGPAQIVTVDESSHELTLSRNGQTVDTAPVSLGAAATPTMRGVKVIMEKGRDISMSGPGYSDPHVQWTQRLTYSGEYLHAAPWNTSNIEKGVDTSNGCTNLTDADARMLYRQLRVGDVVQYPNATGPRMTLGEGFGDWNVSWRQWLTGGAVPTS